VQARRRAEEVKRSATQAQDSQGCVRKAWREGEEIRGIIRQFKELAARIRRPRDPRHKALPAGD